MVRTGKTMLDDVIRVSFLILTGFTLGIAVIWYLGLLSQEIRGTGQIVIVPLTVIDKGGKTNDELGKALAQMLQARLQSLVRELRDAQAGFTTNVRAPALAQGAPAAPGRRRPALDSNRCAPDGPLAAHGHTALRGRGGCRWDITVAPTLAEQPPHSSFHALLARN